MHTPYPRPQPNAAPPASQAWALLGRVAEILRTYPDGPHLEFPGFGSARVGAVARGILEAGGRPWHLGGFRFADGSVLRCEGRINCFEEWSVLGAEEARRMVQALAWQPLEVRLMYVFTGLDGRLRRSLAEARFVFREDTQTWRLTVEYEPFMASPLYGFAGDSFADLLEAGVEHVAVRPAVPSQAWRLEQIAVCPEWVELLG